MSPEQTLSCRAPLGTSPTPSPGSGHRGPQLGQVVGPCALLALSSLGLSARDSAGHPASPTGEPGECGGTRAGAQRSLHGPGPGQGLGSFRSQHRPLVLSRRERAGRRSVDLAQPVPPTGRRLGALLAPAAGGEGGVTGRITVSGGERGRMPPRGPVLCLVRTEHLHSSSKTTIPPLLGLGQACVKQGHRLGALSW